MSFHLLETGKVHILVVAQHNLLSVLVDIGSQPVKVHHCPNISTYSYLCPQNCQLHSSNAQNKTFPILIFFLKLKQAFSY